VFSRSLTIVLLRRWIGRGYHPVIDQASHCGDSEVLSARHLGLAQFGALKLGQPDEKPAFTDFVWFTMLFTAGIGVQFYSLAANETIDNFRGYPNVHVTPWTTDDERAQQAIFITQFHWGLHAWAAYIVVALNLAIVCYRKGYPLSLRYGFQPLLGDKIVNSWVGDLIDALAIAITTLAIAAQLGCGLAV
jgi:choline-glycine betaine transporter